MSLWEFHFVQWLEVITHSIKIIWRIIWNTTWTLGSFTQQQFLLTICTFLPDSVYKPQHRRLNFIQFAVLFLFFFCHCQNFTGATCHSLPFHFLHVTVLRLYILLLVWNWPLVNRSSGTQIGNVGQDCMVGEEEFRHTVRAEAQPNWKMNLNVYKLASLLKILILR